MGRQYLINLWGYWTPKFVVPTKQMEFFMKKKYAQNSLKCKMNIDFVLLIWCPNLRGGGVGVCWLVQVLNFSHFFRLKEASFLCKTIFSRVFLQLFLLCTRLRHYFAMNHMNLLAPNNVLPKIIKLPESIEWTYEFFFLNPFAGVEN